MSQPHWNREQAGGLLTAGAGTIAAFQTALFSSWVDATVAAGQCSSGRTAEVVVWVGLVSVVLMAIVWMLAPLGIALGWACLLQGGAT